MDNSVRVLHIFSGFGGGVSSLIKNLIENKTEDCIFDTMAFSYENGDAFVELIKQKGGNSFIMPRLKKDGLFALLKYVRKSLYDTRYDIIHCHLSSFTALPFLVLFKLCKINKIIIHAHSTIQDSWWDRLPVFYQIGQWINYHFSDAFFTCSDLAAEYVFGKKYLAKRETILIPNGINENLFRNEITSTQKSNYISEFNIDQGEKVILHVGRFNIQKNHSFMLDLIEDLKKKNSKVVLLFAGEGELLEEIKTKAKTKNIIDNVRFLNRRSDVSLLMQFADIVILPSLNEGLPTVAIECQAAGTPILMSDSITKQCDMGLGLVKFISIDDSSEWLQIIEDEGNRLSVDFCLDAIRNKGFTAEKAGIEYCRLLRKLVFEE